MKTSSISIYFKSLWILGMSLTLGLTFKPMIQTASMLLDPYLSLLCRPNLDQVDPLLALRLLLG